MAVMTGMDIKINLNGSGMKKIYFLPYVKIVFVKAADVIALSYGEPGAAGDSVTEEEIVW